MSNNLLAINGKIMGMEPMASSGSFPAFTKLWENPNPSSTFAAQNITLLSDDYDFLLWDVSFSGSWHTGYICPKGTGVPFEATTTSGGSYIVNRQRNITYISDVVYAVDDSYTQNSNAVKSKNNDYLIPVAVYGFKKNIDISSLITNVSTSADQCMLSDEVTSVEDKLNDLDRGSITVTGDASKTYSQVLDSLFALVDPTKLTAKSVLQVTVSAAIVLNLVYIVNDGTPHFSRAIVDGAASNTIVDTVSIKPSGSTWYRSTITTTATYSNRSSNTVGSGMPITLYY